MIIGLLGLIFAIGMVFLSHTPRWLVERGRDEEAFDVLTRINHQRGNETSVETLQESMVLKEKTMEDSK